MSGIDYVRTLIGTSTHPSQPRNHHARSSSPHGAQPKDRPSEPTRPNINGDSFRLRRPGGPHRAVRRLRSDRRRRWGRDRLLKPLLRRSSRFPEGRVTLPPPSVPPRWGVTVESPDVLRSSIGRALTQAVRARARVRPSLPMRPSRPGSPILPRRRLSFPRRPERHGADTSPGSTRVTGPPLPYGAMSTPRARTEPGPWKPDGPPLFTTARPRIDRLLHAGLPGQSLPPWEHRRRDHAFVALIRMRRSRNRSDERLTRHIPRCGKRPSPRSRRSVRARRRRSLRPQFRRSRRLRPRRCLRPRRRRSFRPPDKRSLGLLHFPRPPAPLDPGHLRQPFSHPLLVAGELRDQKPHREDRRRQHRPHKQPRPHTTSPLNTNTSPYGHRQ